MMRELEQLLGMSNHGVSRYSWYIRLQYRRWLRGQRGSKPDFATMSLSDESELLCDLFDELVGPR